MNEYKSPVVSSEDHHIEEIGRRLESDLSYYSSQVKRLQERRADFIRRVSEGGILSNRAAYTIVLSSMDNEISFCSVMVKDIQEQIGAPDENSLWTSDAISAEIVEEWHYEAVQEVERLKQELNDHQRAHIRATGVSDLSEKAAVIEGELVEALEWRRRCSDSLSTNPNSDWLPF